MASAADLVDRAADRPSLVCTRIWLRPPISAATVAATFTLRKKRPALHLDTAVISGTNHLVVASQIGSMLG